MDQQTQQQVEQSLRANWGRLRYQILDQFAQVSTADLDAANTVNDLVERIAAKAHYPENFVERRISELVGVGAPAATGQGASITSQGQPFRHSGGQQASSQGMQQGQPFGQS